jgi:hypothetical protein
MKSLLLTVTMVLVALPAIAQQPTNPTYVVTVHQCDATRMQTLVEDAQERSGPIGQALVNEGVLMATGTAVHQWGDEYNLLNWAAAADIPAVLEGLEESNRRYAAAHPEDDPFFEICPRHRDNFYIQRSITEANAPAVGAENTPTLAISYYTCPYPELGGILREMIERSQPIAQTMVDEGAIGSQAIYTHSWGDEWNLAITRTAPDLPALLVALNTMGERYSAEYGADMQTGIDQHCTAHKDNIYTIVQATGPAAN